MIRRVARVMIFFGFCRGNENFATFLYYVCYCGSDVLLQWQKAIAITFDDVPGEVSFCYNSIFFAPARTVLLQ
jgi:hypothetical protein